MFPLLVPIEAYLVCLGIGLMAYEAFFTKDASKSSVGRFSAIGLALGLLLVILKSLQNPSIPSAPTGLAAFYQGFAILATLLVTLMSLDFRKVLARFTDQQESEAGTGEFYFLPIFACAGMCWMARAQDFISAFVALELITVTFYVLVAYLRRNVGSLEAGVKYLILGALSTGFLVYGLAWIYGATGTSLLSDLPAAIHQAVAAGRQSMLLFGLALTLIGLAFKVGAVPMQWWIPDVYQGAPTPVTAFLSVASKAAGFSLAVLLLAPFFEVEATRLPLSQALGIMAGATLLIGNLAALAQSNFKRLLGYSSIAHAGFLLLALSSWHSTSAAQSTLQAPTLIAFYLATYLIMTFGALFSLSIISQSEGSNEISAFNGLGKRNPLLALLISLFVASLAGLPLTAGFFGKFFVFENAIAAQQWPLVIIGFIAVAAGFFYYSKLFRAMYWLQPSNPSAIIVPRISRLCLLTFAVLTLILGIWPDPILWIIG